MTINKYLYFLGLLFLVLVLPITISGADVNNSSVGVVDSCSGDSFVSSVGVVDSCSGDSFVSSVGVVDSCSGDSFVSSVGVVDSCSGDSLGVKFNEFKGSNSLEDNSKNFDIINSDSISTYSLDSNVKYVSLNGSDYNDGNTISTAYKSIDTALNNSLENGTVYIDDGTYIINQSFAGFKINKSIIISAINYGNVYIDCSNVSRFVSYIANYNSLSLMGLNILNGNGEYGGAIFSGSNEKGNNYVKIINSSFYNNCGGIAGGAIYIFGGSVEVINSSLYNNSANRAGAIYVYDGKVILKNSSFYNNLATVYGGAVLWANEKTDVFVDSSEFYTNFAFVDGGVINSYLGDITISNSNFHNNIAKRYGGVISNKEGFITINSSKFINNSGFEGGAIYHYSNSLAN